MTRYNVNQHNDEAIVTALDTPIPAELVSERSGGGRTTYSYVKGDVDADRLNEVFGPLGWDCQSGKPEITRFEDKRVLKKYVDGQQGKQDVETDCWIYVVTTQVTLRIKARGPESSDTTFTCSGLGYGEAEIGKHAKDAIAMAVKGAETDGFKRCATNLGKAFGMFLTSGGHQEDIVYAHNGNDQGLKRAKQIRSRSEGRGAPPPQQKAETERPRPTRAEQPQEPAKASAGHASGPAPEPETRQPRRGSRPQRTPNDNFNLDSEPVTREDQIDWGATFVRKLSERGSPHEREGMVLLHLRTINSLDGQIRDRLRSTATDHGIDIDRIAA